MIVFPKNKRYWDFKYKDLYSEDMEEFVDYFQNKKPNIKGLDLSNNKINDKGVRKLLEGLEYLPCLKELGLSGNYLTDNILRDLADFSIRYPRLRYVEVTNNKITRDSISEEMSRLRFVYQYPYEDGLFIINSLEYDE